MASQILPIAAQASRVRREASPSELAGDFAAVDWLPKLLATGVQDRIVPPARVVALAEQIGGSSRSVMIPACGHLSHEEAAPDLLAHLALFIEEVMPTT